MKVKVLTIIKYVILIGTFLFFYITYQGWPNRVQIHFGGANNPLGSKGLILVGNIIIWLKGVWNRNMSEEIIKFPRNFLVIPRN